LNSTETALSLPRYFGIILNMQQVFI